MLDTIITFEHPDDCALVEYHPETADFGYNYEARQRVYNFYVFQGYPSLFADGVDLWPISTWRPFINNRVNVSSPFTLTITGNYDPVNNNGSITASYQNDSSAAITARVYFVITEDSLYHVDPNGHAWHNNLCRDFLPTQTGELFTVNPGQVINVNRDFVIDPSWVENRCRIVTWIQADAPSRNGYQAGKVKLMNLVGIEENNIDIVQNTTVSLVNNPCSAHDIRFLLDVPQGTSYRIDIFDVIGRRVQTITGTTENDREIVRCDLRGSEIGQVSSGVYLYRITSSELNTTGKVIVK